MNRKRTKRAGLDRVGLYYRCSTDMQDKSIVRQKAEVEPYVKRKGWVIVGDPIEDEGISGTEVLKRPGLQRLLAMVRNGEIDGIVVDDLDRLLRLDLLEMGELLSPLRRAGVWIESVSQGRFDYETMQGRLTLGVSSEGKKMQALASARSSLSQQLRMARDLGEPPLTKPPYGYRRVEDMDKPLDRKQKRPGKWVIVPQEAEVVIQIFAWYAKGWTTGQICQELRRRAVVTRTGRTHWHRSTIREILDNPAYIGDRAWGKSASGKWFRQDGGEIVQGDGVGKSERRPPEEWIFGTEKHEAIITDRDVWKKVKERRDRSRRRDFYDDQGDVLRQEGEAPSPAAPGAYLLSRVLVCGKCGAWLTAFTRPYGVQVPAYTCARYMAQGPAGCSRCEVREAECVETLIENLRSLLCADNQEILRQRITEELSAQRRDNDLAALRRRVADLDATLTRHRKRLLEVSPDMVCEIEPLIQEDRVRLQQAREELQRAEELDPVRDLERALEASAAALWTLEEAIADGDRIALGEAIRGVVEKVTVHLAEYKTTTGKTRHKPARYQVTLRKGTGLDLLAQLGVMPTGTSPGLVIDLAEPA